MDLKSREMLVLKPCSPAPIFEQIRVAGCRRDSKYETLRVLQSCCDYVECATVVVSLPPHEACSPHAQPTTLDSWLRFSHRHYLLKRPTSAETILRGDFTKLFVCKCHLPAAFADHVSGLSGLTSNSSVRAVCEYGP